MINRGGSINKAFWITFGATAIIITAGWGDEGQPAALTIPAVAAAPMLDGRLDDPAWAQAGKVETLYEIGGGHPSRETKLWLCRDSSWLYIGAQCLNPRMEHVAQQAYAHDSAVHNDDSLEFFIRPSPDAGAPYYHFILNFANVGKEQRCFPSGGPDIGWDPAWRTVTHRQADGWAAEIAIPFCAMEAPDWQGLSLNFGRTCMQVTLDDYGSKNNETRVLYTLRPGARGGFHNLANFLPVSGMAGFQPAAPFAPQIAGASIAGVGQAEGRNIYNLRVTLDITTAVAGAARLQVMEDFGDGERESFTQDVELRGRRELELPIPAGDLRRREVRAVLRHPADGNLLAARAVEDTAALSLIRKTFAGRSYYTTETEAAIRVELGLPENMLARAALALEAGGERLVELRPLQPVMTPTVPVAKLVLGTNIVQVRLMLEGRELAAEPVTIVRLPPRPGHEVQADLLHGRLLKDKQPIFPVGMVGYALQMRLDIAGSTEDDEDMFKFLAEDIGLNCLVRSKTSKHTAAFMALAEKYGFYVINWTAPQPMPMEYLTPPRSPHLPLAERLAVHRDWYRQLEPALAEDTKILRDYKNLIGYWNVDEPNLLNADERIAAAEWYWRTVQALDPHRPSMLLYARQIPHGGNWTRWGDILAYDVYPGVYQSGIYNDPGLGTAYYAWELRERCRQDNKIMWFVPISNTTDPGRAPVGLNQAQMLCQAYSAIIYGARGLIYFALSNVVGRQAWDALRAISAQAAAMAPALLNVEPAQHVRYTPDNFDPRAQKFPMVNAAFFRHPDGHYLMLAVNITPYAVETKFEIAGLRSAARMFAPAGSGQPEPAGGSFTEKIEPYGTRAYRLELDGEPETVEAAVTMAAIETEKALWVDLQGIKRQLAMSKNHMPNPCFEQQTNPGVPDFYRPYFCLTVDPYWGEKGKSDWYVDRTVLWNGRPSLRMYKRGMLEDGFKTRGLISMFFAPVSDQPVRRTFSFYAKTDQPKASIWIRLNGDHTVSGLRSEWTRHHIAFESRGPATIMMIPSEKASIWISGLQVEEGEAPTAFQDDSVLRPTAARDPGNLLDNPGAECASAENWRGLEATWRGEFGVRRGAGRAGEYAFYWGGQSPDGIRSDWIAVDTNKVYKLRGWFKAAAEKPAGAVFGLFFADAQQRAINHWNVFSVRGTATELTAPCWKGDRILRLQDASTWQTGASFFAAFGAGENEYATVVAPNGIAELRRDGGDWSAVLHQGCNFDMPSGTLVVENRAGNNGWFLPGAGRITNVWTEVRGTIGPGQWWPGTAFARVAVLPAADSVLLMDDFALREAR